MKSIQTMIDSGAFSVWKRGMEIDLDEYISFCKSHPELTYCINLDVIPGKPFRPVSKSPKGIEKCCEKSWENYKKMVRGLGVDRVIPVYHQGDDIKWLRRYLKRGCPYVGVSPNKDVSILKRLSWLRSINPLLFEDRKPKVKIHAFGVTISSFLFEFAWESSDSTMWKKQSAFGAIIVPRSKKGKYTYSMPPYALGLSELSPSKKSRGRHLSSCSPGEKKYFMKYIESLELPLGESEIKEVKDVDYGLQENEDWLDKNKRLVLVKLKVGLTNHYPTRDMANLRYTQALERESLVNRIYCAAAFSTKDNVLKQIKSRLLAFPETKAKSVVEKLSIK